MEHQNQKISRFSTKHQGVLKNIFLTRKDGKNGSPRIPFFRAFRVENGGHQSEGTLMKRTPETILHGGLFNFYIFNFNRPTTRTHGTKT